MFLGFGMWILKNYHTLPIKDVFVSGMRFYDMAVKT